MRDLFAMFFAANLVCAAFAALEGKTAPLAVNGFAAAVCYVSWRALRAEDQRGAE